MPRTRDTNTTKLRIEPATADRWSDVETVFTAPGCAVARNCWCMYYRESGRVEVPAGESLAQERKRRLRALVASNAVPGLLACRDGEPVGWVCLGPRGEFAKLRRSPVLRAVDDEDVWSIVCFVVPSAHRHQGVARALLQGAVTYAASRGARLLEAYPVDKPGHAKDDTLWFGTKSMYDRAGFVEVARRKPGRPIVRKRLRARRPAGSR